MYLDAGCQIVPDLHFVRCFKNIPPFCWERARAYTHKRQYSHHQQFTLAAAHKLSTAVPAAEHSLPPGGLQGTNLHGSAEGSLFLGSFFYYLAPRQQYFSVAARSYFIGGAFIRHLWRVQIYDCRGVDWLQSAICFTLGCDREEKSDKINGCKGWNLKREYTRIKWSGGAKSHHASLPLSGFRWCMWCDIIFTIMWHRRPCIKNFNETNNLERLLPSRPNGPQKSGFAFYYFSVLWLFIANGET